MRIKFNDRIVKIKILIESDQSVDMFVYLSVCISMSVQLVIANLNKHKVGATHWGKNNTTMNLQREKKKRKKNKIIKNRIQPNEKTI